MHNRNSITPEEEHLLKGLASPLARMFGYAVTVDASNRRISLDPRLKDHPVDRLIKMGLLAESKVIGSLLGVFLGSTANTRFIVLTDEGAEMVQSLG